MLVAVSLVALGLLQAGHIHKPDADLHRVQSICVLCLHGDHAAAVPAAAPLQVSYVAWLTPSPAIIAGRASASGSLYFARGPPQA